MDFFKDVFHTLNESSTLNSGFHPQFFLPNIKFASPSYLFVSFLFCFRFCYYFSETPVYKLVPVLSPLPCLQYTSDWTAGSSSTRSSDRAHKLWRSVRLQYNLINILWSSWLKGIARERTLLRMVENHGGTLK